SSRTRLPARLPSLSSLTSFDLWPNPRRSTSSIIEASSPSLSSGICDPFENSSALIARPLYYRLFFFSSLRSPRIAR
ncbi:hypothetical protein PGT21_000005, partial [Puccinia graminis f. sp. tritici]